MQPLAHFALAGTIVTCALGAIILCLLVLRYGFTVPGEEPTETTMHRLYVTRVGHTAAAACFALAAGLTAVALILQSRGLSPTGSTARLATAAEAARDAARDAAREAREAREAARVVAGDVTRQEIARVDARQAEVVERLGTLDTRVRGTEARLDDLRAAQAREAVKLTGVERSTALKLATLERTARPKLSTAIPSPHPDRPAGTVASGVPASPVAPVSRPSSEAVAPRAQSVPAVTDTPPATHDNDGPRTEPGPAREERPPEAAFATPPAEEASSDRGDIFVSAQRAIVTSRRHAVSREIEALAKGLQEGLQHVVTQVGRTLRTITE